MIERVRRAVIVGDSLSSLVVAQSTDALPLRLSSNSEQSVITRCLTESDLSHIHTVRTTVKVNGE